MSGLPEGWVSVKLGALTSPRVRAVRLATFHNCRLSGWNNRSAYAQASWDSPINNNEKHSLSLLQG